MCRAFAETAEVHHLNDDVHDLAREKAQPGHKLDLLELPLLRSCEEVVGDGLPVLLRGLFGNSRFYPVGLSGLEFFVISTTGCIRWIGVGRDASYVDRSIDLLDGVTRAPWPSTNWPSTASAST